jgi:hypothetical protein
MAPHKRRPTFSHAGHSRAAKVAIEASKFYHEFVPQEDRAVMPTLEEEVKLVREFKEDEEVEH